MKRSQFFAFLGGLLPFAAKAQIKTPNLTQEESEAVLGKASLMVEGRKLEWFSGKPLNNQCPICGTMAEAYKAQRYPKNCESGPEGSHYVICDSTPLPSANIIRCKRCNAAFFQDGE